MSEKVLMAGNHALADAALAAGVKVVAGYPITPSSEVVELISQKIPQYGGRFIQMEDEIASIGVIIGASAIGAKAMTATSGPGFSLMQEMIGYAAMVELPIVIYNAQRVGPSTGGATKPQQADIMQTKWGSHGESPRIALCPGTVQEIYELTIEAFNLAEKYMVPVVILTDEILAHMRESVELPDPGKIRIVNRRKDGGPKDDFLPYKVDETGIPVLPPMGEGYRYNVAGMIHGENGMPNLSPDIIESCICRINDKIENNYEDIVKYESIKNDNATIAVVCFGTPTRPGKGAVIKACENGVEAEFFRPITMWPFPVREICEVVQRVDKILVVEMNMGQVAGIVREAIEGKAEVHQHNRIDGSPITMDEIYQAIMEIGK